jgi:hypothetical protein
LVVGVFNSPVASGQQTPSPQPVVVTNGTASPVPVGGTVNVGNLPATQPVSGTVAISGVPTVSLQGPQPFHDSVYITRAGGFQDSVAIPAGQRLVVQSISLSTANAAVTGCDVATFSDNLNGVLYFLPLENGNSQCSGAESGESLFWSAESQITISAPGFSSPGDPTFRVTVSGFLVP